MLIDLHLHTPAPHQKAKWTFAPFTRLFDRKGHACDAQFAWGRCLIWGVEGVASVEGTGKVSQVSQEVTGFFRSSACVRATVDNSDNAGPLGCAGRWRALQLHVPAALTRAARARHADADLVNLSLRPTYDQPPVAPAARSSHRVAFCQCRCHASHYTELAHRHSRRAIADGSREPEYAPPTTSPLHLPRVPHTVAFAKAGAILQVTTPSC